MFEIVLVGYLSYRNGLRARLKSQNPFVWGLITFIAFMLTMMFGVFIVIVYFCTNIINFNQLASLDVKSREAAAQQLVDIFYTHPLHMVTIELFGIGGYLFVRYLLDRIPNKKEPEVHWMDKMGKSE